MALSSLPLAMAVGCSSAGEPVDVAGPRTGATGTGLPQGDTAPDPRTSPSTDDSLQPPGFTNPHVPASPTTGSGAGQPGIAAGPGVRVPAGERADRPVQPGVTTPGRLPRLLEAMPDYPVPANYRPIPDASVPAPPIDWQSLHAPVPVEPVAPIAPPPRTLRLGDFTSPVPDDLPGPVLDTVNGLAAHAEAAIATGGQSIGLAPGRADKVAAGIVAGAALGVVGASIPAAVAGAAAGAAVGAAIGFGVGVAGTPAGTALGAAVAGLPTGGAAAVPGAVAGALAVAGTSTAVGAAIGAAVGGVGAGLGAAVLGGVAGAAAGGIIGAHV